jgi:ubiquinone biosynthesis protein COQ4
VAIMKANEFYLTLRSIVRVLADSNQTTEIHTVEEITGRAAMKRMLEQAHQTPSGRKLLRQQPEFNQLHIDYDWLRRLPENSLGFAYVCHLDRNQITAETQALPVTHVDDPDIAYLLRRYRQTHDIWHPLLGLNTQPHEEVLVHAFSWGQLSLPVSQMVVLLGTPKHLILERRWGALRHGLQEAYRHGKQAQSLLLVPWEQDWETPLEEVRSKYNILPCSPSYVNN